MTVARDARADVALSGRMAGWRGLVAAIALAAPLYLFGTFNHDLWRPAEAREAGIAREMIENGNWVATHLNGRLFLEKPPLYTWTLAFPLKVFGYREWAVRIPVFAFTMGTLALTYLLARRRMGWSGAAAATVALASMWLFMEVNHGAMVDNGLVFFTTLGLLAFDRVRAPESVSAWRAAAFYVGLGLAFLCKGAIGPALMLAAVAGYCWYCRQWRILPGLRPGLGLAILALIVGAWLAALWIKGGKEYYWVFFVKNHIYRFIGREGPQASLGLVYYVPYLLSGGAPWTLLLPAAVRLVWRRQAAAGPGEDRNKWLFLLAWPAAMFVLLSLAESKDNQYLLPLLPPLAVLAGAWVEHTIEGGAMARWELVLTRAFAAVVALGMLALPCAPVVVGRGTAWISAAFVAVMTVGAFMTARHVIGGDWRGVWRSLAGMCVGSGLVIGVLVEGVLNERKSAKPLCEDIVMSLPDGVKLWDYGINENTQGLLIFYGCRSSPLTTLAEILKVGQAPAPAALIFEGRLEDHEVGRHLFRSRCWFLARRITVAGRDYSLLANKAALPLWTDVLKNIEAPGINQNDAGDKKDA